MSETTSTNIIEKCNCIYCGSTRTNKSGIINNKQRYYCRECKRTFREGNDRRVKYSEDFKISAISWYLDNCGIRTISRQLKVPASLIVYWAKEFGKIVKNKIFKAADNIDEKNLNKDNIQILEIDEIVTYVKKT